MSFSDEVVELAPAKVNLALHVVGRRTDGYHLIESLCVFTDFGDIVTVRRAGHDRFDISGPRFGHVPTDGANLVVRARDALRHAFPSRVGPSAITLEKHIPVQSGVGGGSSDAAATLRALAKVWDIEVSEEALCAIGVTLGADVPMCALHKPLVARGIGEILSPCDMPPLPLVLVNPGSAVSTPSVFAALSSRKNDPLPALPSNPDFAVLADWLSQTRNDLEGPAKTIAPAIAHATASLRRSGAAFARMSGSGATCFGLYASPASAEVAACAIARANPGWFVTATTATPSDASNEG